MLPLAEKQSEEQLRSKPGRLGAILHHAPIGINIVDRDGVVMLVEGVPDTALAIRAAPAVLITELYRKKQTIRNTAIQNGSDSKAARSVPLKKRVPSCLRIKGEGSGPKPTIGSIAAACWVRADNAMFEPFGML